MRIYDQNPTGASAAESSRAQETQRTAQGSAHQTGKAAGPADSVEFSGALGRLSRTIAADGANRQARVQALAAQYQSGQYHVDSLQTSRAIISDAMSTGVA